MTRPARSDLVLHGDPAPALNENHVRRLPSTFW
jgi:hypothetical protein